MMARQLTMNLYVEHLKKQYVGATRKEKCNYSASLELNLPRPFDFDAIFV